MQRTHTKTIYSHTLSKLNCIWILIRWKCMCVFGCVQCACQLRKVVRALLNWMNEYTPRMHTHTLISAMKRKRNENKRQFMTRNFRVGFFSLSSFLIHFSLVRFCLDFNPERNGKDFHKIVFDLSIPSHGRTLLRFFTLVLQTNLNFILIALVSVTKSVRTHAHTSRV